MQTATNSGPLLEISRSRIEASSRLGNGVATSSLFYFVFFLRFFQRFVCFHSDSKPCARPVKAAHAQSLSMIIIVIAQVLRENRVRSPSLAAATETNEDANEESEFRIIKRTVR